MQCRGGGGGEGSKEGLPFRDHGVGFDVVGIGADQRDVKRSTLWGVGVDDEVAGCVGRQIDGCKGVAIGDERHQAGTVGSDEPPAWLGGCHDGWSEAVIEYIRELEAAT